jgi:cytochrome d ubiquinol oxidase subunit I
VLRTADATSPVLGTTILGTLALFVIAYGIVFSFGIYYINRLIALGPRAGDTHEPANFSASPIAAARDEGREALNKGSS